MASLSTGKIENAGRNGVRPSSTIDIRIRNNDTVATSVQTIGSYLVGKSKTEYVLESFTIAPEGLESRKYYVQFEAYEFKFITSSDVVEISAWGSDAAGNLSMVHRVLPVELTTISFENRKYIVNTGSNTVSVIDRKTKSILATVAVGIRPVSVGVNPVTKQIYVSNQGSDNVSVIDGYSNQVVATIKVGVSPSGVEVNSTTNQIRIMNEGSNNVSVINGTINTVIATVAR